MVKTKTIKTIKKNQKNQHLFLFFYKIGGPFWDKFIKKFFLQIKKKISMNT